MIYEDDEVEFTDEEIQELYDKALSVVLTNADVGWIHIPTSRNSTVGLCGCDGDHALYFAPVYDLSSNDICDMCATLKAMES